jgi:hypothetical protein
MEVASIITSRKDVLNIFRDFILSYPKLKLKLKDSDTMYFTNGKDEKIQIYFHYLINDTGSEFSYNYTESAVSKIEKYFDDQMIYIFDISFREELILRQMINDFVSYLLKMNDKDAIERILFDHPHYGIMSLVFYCDMS